MISAKNLAQVIMKIIKQYWLVYYIVIRLLATEWPLYVATRANLTQNGLFF